MKHLLKNIILKKSSYFAKAKTQGKVCGFTIMEVLIVVAVLGIILLIALPQFSKMRENQVLKSAVGDVLSSLNRARGQTLASVDSFSYGVRFESDKVIIFKGISFSPGSVDNETVSIISPATISSINVANSELYFNRLSGTPNQTGSIIISTPNYSKTITISATGVASAN